MHSYHPAKIPKIRISPLCTLEKFKFSEFLLDDKNATYFSSFKLFLLYEKFAMQCEIGICQKHHTKVTMILSIECNFFFESEFTMLLFVQQLLFLIICYIILHSVSFYKFRFYNDYVPGPSQAGGLGSEHCIFVGKNNPLKKI